MLYYCLKILHVISATFVLTSIAYCFYLWRHIPIINDANGSLADRIQTQTWLIIVPFAIFQLASGFSMISLQHYDFSQLWIKGSVFGFITVICSWFGFIYFLFAGKKHRIIQTLLLIICSIALLCMIFFMANKI